MAAGKEFVNFILCCLLSLCYWIFFKNCFVLHSCDHFVSVAGYNAQQFKLYVLLLIPGFHFIDLRRMKGWVDLGANQALAWHTGDSPYSHYHPCKSRKRRLRQAMKSPSKGKAAWANISSSSRINFNWFNIRLILLTLDFKSLIFKTNLNCSYILFLDIISIMQWGFCKYVV